MSNIQKFSILSEKVPIEATLDGIKYIEQNKDKESLIKYIESIMPFGEKAAVKYRGKFFERFIECNGDTVINTPLIKFINNIENYQCKKEIIYFITCTKHDCIGDSVKLFSDEGSGDEFTGQELFDFIKAHMPEAKDSSITKTNSIVLNVLKDFNVIITSIDAINKKRIYKLNQNIRPANETILFCLYYEFMKIKDSKMPKTEAVLKADVFKYFLMSDQLIRKYLKWLQDSGYIDNYIMGDNSQYQFKFDSLDDLVEKVIG